MSSPSPRERFAAFRRALPRSPRLVARRVAARGLDFAVFTTPEVPGVAPLACVNGGMLFSHKLLWPALAPLAHERQLVLYDQRGRGDSSAPPGAQSARIEHDAGDLRAIREALGIPQWDVLGHSWGGGIAMLGAARDPEGVRRLVLVNAVGPRSDAWLPHLHGRALARLSGPARDALAALDPDTLHHADPGVHVAYGRAIYPAWFAHAEMAELFAPPHAESRTGSHVVARLRREGYDWTADVGAVRAPTLVLHGDGDLLPVTVAHDIAAAIPRHRLVLVPGAGHMPFWEAPDLFFPAVEHFLRAPDPLPA